MQCGEVNNLCHEFWPTDPRKWPWGEGGDGDGRSDLQDIGWVTNFQCLEHRLSNQSSQQGITAHSTSCPRARWRTPAVIWRCGSLDVGLVVGIGQGCRPSSFSKRLGTESVCRNAQVRLNLLRMRSDLPVQQRMLAARRPLFCIPDERSKRTRATVQVTARCPWNLQHHRISLTPFHVIRSTVGRALCTGLTNCGGGSPQRRILK